MQDLLENGLRSLNTWLKENDRHLELTVIGAYALRIQNIIDRQTVDIDAVNSSVDQVVLDKIIEIEEQIGVEDWLNFNAVGIPLPEGYENRLHRNTSFSNMSILALDRSDLILLKISAHFIRGEYDQRDIEDLKKLKITPEDIHRGIDFIRKTNSPPEEYQRGQIDFDRQIKELKEELMRLYDGA